MTARDERELRRQQAWEASAVQALRTIGATDEEGVAGEDAVSLEADGRDGMPMGAAESGPPGADGSESSLPTLRVLGFSISRKRLEQGIRELGLPVVIVDDIDEADIVMTLRHAYRQKQGVLGDAEERAIPIYVLKANTVLQMEACLTSLYSIEVDPREAALRETEEAIGLVMRGSQPVELSPQNAYIRRLQHQLAERANVVSRSSGREPSRHVRLYPDRGRSRR